MHPRGTAQPGDDVPHLVLTGILVLLNLAAIGFASGSFSRAFRFYSLSTVVLLIALGAGSAPYGARMAAGEPTPGFGIVERMVIYANMLWIGVLAAALLRRPRVGVTGPLTAASRSRWILLDLPLTPGE
jgi:hypothetical protein